MLLARELGYTLKDLLASLGEHELELWYEIHKREPIGQPWLRHGILCSTITDTVSIDLKKGNAASAYTTMLTSPLVLDNASVTRTVYDVIPTSPNYVAEDSLELVVTVSGSSCQGIVVTVSVAEAAL